MYYATENTDYLTAPPTYVSSTYASSLLMPLPKREYNAVSAERLTKFGNIVWVEASRYLTKITTLRREAARSNVLVAKHTASLQLLCTASGNQAKLDRICN